MKVLYVDMARVLWFFDTRTVNLGGKSLASVLEGIKVKYKFSKAPQHPLDFNEADKALSFEAGTFQTSGKKAIGITFQIYNNALVAQSQSSTDDSSEFLGNVTSWMAEKYELEIPQEIVVHRAFISQVTVKLNHAPPILNPKVAAICRQIDAELKTSDGRPRHFDVGGFGLWSEDVAEGLAPAQFKFERKFAKPFKENIYFTQAPLPTSRLIELLQEIENLSEPK